MLLNTVAVSNLLCELNNGKLLIVDSHRRSGLILFKPFYAEFAGPGAAIGGVFDHHCKSIMPVGDFSATEPTSQEERQKSYLIRRQWIRLTHQITEHPVTEERVQMILKQFENYFDSSTVAQLPDEVFALMVGVLPQTVHRVRHVLNRPQLEVIHQD
jgi:hypothetical protein